MEKECSKCKSLKPIENFCKDKQKKDGYSPACKSCVRSTTKEYRDNNRDVINKRARDSYHGEHRENVLENSKIRYKENKDLLNSKSKENYNKKKEYYQLKARERQKRNREQINEQRRERKEKDPNFRIVGNLRSRVSAAIKNQGGVKAFKTIELLGTTVDHTRDHLESQFVEGMSWSNYGEWHIDHIVPCAAFDLTDIEQQKKCFHYTNLQPLWAKDNISKGDKVI